MAPVSDPAPILSIKTIKGPVHDLDDYTFHARAKEVHEAFGRAPFSLEPAYSGTLQIEDPHTGAKIVGRGLVCSCYQKQEYSVTIRSNKEGRVQKPGESGATLQLQSHPAGMVPSVSGYKAQDHWSPEYPLSFAQICDVLFEQIFTEPNPHGLVAVTGSTSAGKSQIVRGLIFRHLIGRIPTDPGKRWPHLVTFEDPIEALLTDGPKSAGKAAECGINYTPRQKALDVSDLAQAIHDALRQTPTVFYIGEVRNAADWPVILNFAGTGHLVVTTSHAGSLVEAMERILQAVGAQSPAERGQFAQRILAVVHLRSVKVGKGTVVLPALWSRSPASIAALVSDGLSSLLPEGPLGRTWFANRFASTFDSLRKEAQKLDLRGE